MKLALPSSDTEDVHYDHARPYRRLLTAVITMSVRDASTPPTKGERRAGRNRLTDARQALRFARSRLCPPQIRMGHTRTPTERRP